MEEQFTFDPKVKKLTFGLMAIGVIALVAGWFSYDIHRFWANVLLNSVFFTLIALGAVFFLAAHNIGKAGWHVAVKRIPEAMSAYLPVGAITMLLTLFGLHELYHWTHSELLDPNAPKYDAIIAGKSGYLNIPFYIIRMLLYLAGWLVMAHLIRKYSLLQDERGPEEGVKWYQRTNTISAIFLVFFAVTSSMASWDWLMSIDAHWYSTLFGWYIFASLWVSTLAAITLIVIYLKKAGYLKLVNTNHLHDLGKFMFAFSIFWTYLWFSQYMLIWYANIPEETAYFMERFEHYQGLFILNLIINFFIPFLVLMDVDAKKNMQILTLTAIVILMGHWLDFFLLVMPGVVQGGWGIGLMEIGLTLGFAGLFIFVVFRALTRADLVPQHHPMLKESMHYHS